MNRPSGRPARAATRVGGGPGGSGRPAPRPDAALPAAPTVIEPRQRWRIVFARDQPSAQPHREIAEAWIASLQASGLPLPRSEGRPRPPLGFAAPLPVGTTAAAELADLTLAERLPIADVQPVVEATMPAGLRLVDLYDVWLGAPALPASLEAAIYRVALDGAVDAAELRGACERLLASRTLERERARGSGTVRYDLRPLLDDVSVEPGELPALRIRTRFDAERGAGRPEEVVAALGELLGRPLPAGRTHRERLVLAGDR